MLENISDSIITVAVPILLGMGYRWLQTIVGESNARLLASVARQAVLGVEERYLADDRAMSGPKKHEMAIEQVKIQFDKQGRGVFPNPFRNFSSSIGEDTLKCAIEASVHELFNSPERQMVHAEAMQRVKTQARAEIEASGRQIDPQDVDAEVRRMLTDLGLKPRSFAGAQS